MNVNKAIRNRKLGLTSKIDIDFTINKLRLQEAVKLRDLEGIDPVDNAGPLACIKLSKSNSNIIAIASEDGYVDLMNSKRIKNIAHWTAHNNAIFDIKTTPDSRSLLTASGDRSIKLWDIETKTCVKSLIPHFSSVKSISIFDANTFASGSRDGTIKIHDLREKRPTKIVIRDAHRNRKIAKTRRTITKTDPISCVTNVVCDELTRRVYSTGANDATIKLWDIRYKSKVNKPRRTVDGELLINEPYMTVHHPSDGIHCGYSHLLLSDNRLYAACSDNKIYCYENFNPDEQPIRFVGYHYDTYLKMAIMDERFLISGAKMGGPIMWSLSHRSKSPHYYPATTRLPIGQLKPDDNETFDTNVIETDWTSLSVFTFREDRLVCKWTMNHVLDSDKKKLIEEDAIASQDADVTIEMSDVIDIDVVRPNCRISNFQQTSS